MIFAATIRRIYAATARSLENAKAVRELQAMTDRELDDIGITHDQIEAFVHGRANRDSHGEVRPTVPAGIGARLRQIDTGPIPRAYVH